MHKLMRGAEMAGCLILALVAALTFVDVLGRYVIAKSLPGGYELNQLLQAIVVFWGLALACRARCHITVDLLWERLPARGRGLLDRFSALATAAAMAALFVGAASQLPKMIKAGELIPALSLPLWPFTAMAVLGAALACIASLAPAEPEEGDAS